MSVQLLQHQLQLSQAELKLVLESLKSYPHICKNVHAFWDTPYLGAYVDNLLMDTRNGQRKGFPPEIFGILTTLANRKL